MKHRQSCLQQPKGVYSVAFTPKGGCPLKQISKSPHRVERHAIVAFTPKGGCPLKHKSVGNARVVSLGSSIHPQGWVPIETQRRSTTALSCNSMHVAFTPKGGCLLKLASVFRILTASRAVVAFTPKGGCPLKPHLNNSSVTTMMIAGSIHPQGWVPIETLHRRCFQNTPRGDCSIHPQGWVPIETWV